MHQYLPKITFDRFEKKFAFWHEYKSHSETKGFVCMSKFINSFLHFIYLKSTRGRIFHRWLIISQRCNWMSQANDQNSFWNHSFWMSHFKLLELNVSMDITSRKQSTNSHLWIHVADEVCNDVKWQDTECSEIITKQLILLY